jgi:hypothetical protein
VLRFKGPRGELKAPYTSSLRPHTRMQVVLRCKGPRGELLGKALRILRRDFDLANALASLACMHVIGLGQA